MSTLSAHAQRIKDRVKKEQKASEHLRRPRYSDELRLMVVDYVEGEIKKGVSIVTTTKLLGVNDQNYSRWKKRFSSSRDAARQILEARGHNGNGNGNGKVAAHKKAYWENAKKARAGLKDEPAPAAFKRRDVSNDIRIEYPNGLVVTVPSAAMAIEILRAVAA